MFYKPDKKKRIPSLCLHKPSGLGYVRLGEHTVYLGKYNSPLALEKYNRVMAEYLVSNCWPPKPRYPLTVVELLERYLEYAKNYYTDADGMTNEEFRHMQIISRPLRELYGSTPAASYGPLALRAVREKLIQMGWCRRHVNQNVGRIKRIFRWATEYELVPGTVYHALRAVAGLRRGRCRVRETRRVRPVPQERIEAVRPFVSRQVWALIQLQQLTGARGGELLIMRPCDIDRSGKVWIYIPTRHKSDYFDYDRNIYIGPRAQQILEPFLNREPEVFCFSPKEAMEERRQEAEARRVTPLTYGNRRGTNRKSTPAKTPGNRYTTKSYHRAIQYALYRAYPLPTHLVRKKGESGKWIRRLEKMGLKDELKQWRRLYNWHPHQLRHNAATELRKEFGLEAARIILGHRSAVITELYAEEDRTKAIAAISQIG